MHWFHTITQNLVKCCTTWQLTFTLTAKTNPTYRHHKRPLWLAQLFPTQLYYETSNIEPPSSTVSLETKKEGSVSWTFIMIKVKPMYPYNTLSLTRGFKIPSVHLHPIPHFVLSHRVQPQRGRTQGKDGCQMQLTQRASNTLLSPFISLHREISTRPPHTSCQPPIPFFVLSLGEIWSLLGLVKTET